jgi:hypothetical protein
MALWFISSPLRWLRQHGMYDPRGVEVCAGLNRSESYNEIHHNDEPFIPVFNKKLNTKKKLVCQSCQCDINIKNCISPHNFVISKKERWLRPDTDSDGNKIRVPTHYKMTTRYYCVKSSCILKRHPYFWGRLLKIDQPLNVEQLSLLENNLGYRQ